MWRPLQDFLYRHDLCIAISAAQVAELSEARTLHASMNTLLTAVPSVLIKPPDMILDEEIRSYPHRRTDTLVLYYLNALFGKQDFAQFLSSPDLAEARRQQRLAAKQMKRRFDALKPNFPPSESGEYTWEQAEKFASINTLQWVADTHPLCTASRIRHPISKQKYSCLSRSLVTPSSISTTSMASNLN
jgi:hypothetical protein